jgi:hypothetical protein
VATRQFVAGDKILEETPIIKGRTSEFKSLQWVKLAVANLLPTNREFFYQLQNSFPEKEEVGIMETNCYGLGCDNALSGVFEVFSRINHSCIPNAERWWDLEREVETLYAINDIKENEEITVAYSGDVYYRPLSDRQDLISRGWRFHCLCRCCQLTDPESVAASDRRRRFIGWVDKEVGFRAPHKMIQLVTRALEFIEEEGIVGVIKARLCYDGYQLALEIKNLEQAKRFIKMAYEQYLLATGPTSEQTTKMLRYVRNPKSHMAWGL